MKKINSRETVGKIALDLQAKQPDSADPIEMERAMHEDYGKNMLECLHTGQLDFVGDFYIVVITKCEPLMTNVLRNYFFNRKSCPTPDYDQTVYRYNKTTDDLDFLWVIPSKDTCLQFIQNAPSIPHHEWGLLQFVLKFADGTLYKQAKQLNGEKEESSELIQ